MAADPKPSPPRPSPTVPSDVSLPKLPAEFEKTPSHFPVTAAYVQRKLAESGNAPRWIPNNRTPFWVAVFVGAVSASGPLLMLETVSLRVVIASALMGAASSMAAFFGMRSAGVQKR